MLEFISNQVYSSLISLLTRFSHVCICRFIRNVAFVGHSHAGKTALVEWMLFDEHILTQPPRTGQSVLDSDPVEVNRHSSVFSHYCRVPHLNHVLQVADTPWGDFPTDAMATVNGADASILVVSAPDSVQSGTIHAYQYCQHKAGIRPTLLVLSKMDRPFVQLDTVLEDLELELGIKPIPLQVAKGVSETFEGVTPLLQLQQSDGRIVKNHEADPQAWAALEEAVAMTDDDLLVDFLENSKLEPDHVIQGLRKAVLKGQVLPLVYTSAEMDLGVKELMDALVYALPDPMEARAEALRVACENNAGRCGLDPGVEAGFAARVLHTTVDSFGSLSVLRVISNSRNDETGAFDSLPHDAVVLRTGTKIKVPSASTTFSLCGKERVNLGDNDRILPGDVIAVPKLPEEVRTNDILTVPNAVKDEEEEILIEQTTNSLTPLSRPVEDIPLMASATVEVPEESGKKKAKASGGDDKLISALHAMAREDLALRVEQDAASSKLLVRCMSGDHLHLVSERLKERYGLEVVLGQPPVQFRETLVKAVNDIEGKHKKQSGGSGQFGVCVIGMEPLEEGSGVEFESKIKGGVISKPFISSVEKGVREQLQAGGPLGFPVTDVRVTLTDGKMHSVDSKDIAFQSAGKAAVKAALAQGRTRLLQPMEKVTFIVDEKLQGEVNGIVSRHEGYVTLTQPSESRPDYAEIEAILPTSIMAEVSNALRAESAGEGQFTAVFSHYQPVSDDAVGGIVEKHAP